MSAAFQVALYSMYESYFNEDPQEHTLPIPTSFLAAPGDRAVLVDVHKGGRSPEQFESTDGSHPHLQGPRVDDVMENIWETLRKLHGVLIEEKNNLGWEHPVFGKYPILAEVWCVPANLVPSSLIVNPRKFFLWVV
jgi:hypothetical protein